MRFFISVQYTKVQIGALYTLFNLMCRYFSVLLVYNYTQPRNILQRILSFFQNEFDIINKKHFGDIYSFFNLFSTASVQSKQEINYYDTMAIIIEYLEFNGNYFLIHQFKHVFECSKEPSQ